MVQKERRIKREILKRVIINKYELKKKILKSISVNKNTLHINNLYSLYLSRYLLKTKQRSICLLTGRFRGIYKFSRLSRIMINKLNKESKIQNIKKKSW